METAYHRMSHPPSAQQKRHQVAHPAIDQQRGFFDQFDPPQQFHALFKHLPGVIFFVKDAHGRMMAGSPAMVQRYGLSSEQDLIGRTDDEFFPPHIVEGFLRDDRQVMTTGQPLIGRVEVWFNEQRVFDWFVTNKLPLYGSGGKIIGIMGTVSSLDEKRDMLFASARISRAVQHVQEHFAEKLGIEELARLSFLSTRQFRRQFQEVFGMSPQEFLLKTRMQVACKSLVQSHAPLSEIALESGFCDQSSFTMHFRRLLGVTPLQFRRRKMPRPARLVPGLT